MGGSKWWIGAALGFASILWIFGGGGGGGRVIRLPDRPILLFIDEAHLLVESQVGTLKRMLRAQYGST